MSDASEGLTPGELVVAAAAFDSGFSAAVAVMMAMNCPPWLRAGLVAEVEDGHHNPYTGNGDWLSS